MDGVGAATVVGQWARNCFDIQQLGGLKEGVKTGISDVVPSSKPSSRPSASPSKTTRLPLAFAEGEFAVSGQELDRLQKQVQLWKALGLRKPAEARVSLPTSLSKTPASSISSAPILPDLISTVFAASKAAVAHLKAVSTPIHANESPSTSQKSLNTTFDSIAALLWRSIIRARLPDLDKPDDPTAICRLRIPVSVRQALDLPREHTGNAFLHSVTELPLGALLAPGDFGRTACPLIRSSILAVRTPDVARAAVALSSAVPRLLGPDRRQHALFAEGPEGGPPSGRDLVLSSWRDLEWYRHDWGAMFAMPEGRPEFVRMPVGAYHAGLCAILPRRIQRGEEGGSEVEDVEEVVISLTKQQMGRLEQDSEFGKYFQSVVSSKV
ncbi:hypothetical protein SLS53_006659 [Cytospora paraplurivora]|uniref:Uncharacterized protein n=1 Tax=Cytospora paraplurivora TaxID=2898453 RepID=A0AAN9U2H8_9PEZI